MKSKTYFEDLTQDILSKYAKVSQSSELATPFPLVLTRLRKGEFELSDRLGISLANVLHGEQEYHFLSPLKSEMRLGYETEITQTYEKKSRSGEMQFIVLETKVYEALENEFKDQVASAKTTFIHRGSK